jgi:Glycosyl transferase family 8
MLTRFLRIAGAAVVSLLLLAWLYRGESASFHHLTPHSLNNDPFADPITPPAPASQPETKPDLVYYADPPDATPAQGDKKPHVPVKPASPSAVIDRKKTPFGYVLYATSDEYACAALITFARLLEFHTPHRMFALLTKAVSPEYKEAMERLNVTVTIMKPPAHPHPKLHGEAQQGDTKLENSLLRLMAFRIHQLQPDLARVLVIDADTFVYKTLDSLFLLPDVDVAAPRAYWKGKDVLSSKLLLITLSDRLWKSVEGAIKDLGPDEYDAVVINGLFGNTAMVLPGQYMVPNSHWIDWSIPDWYRPEADIHGHGMVKAYSEASLDDLWRIISINVGTDDHNEQKGSTKQKRDLLEEKDEKKVTPSEDDLGEILTPEEAAKELGEEAKLALSRSLFGSNMFFGMTNENLRATCGVRNREETR